MALPHFADEIGATAMTDDVDDHLIVLEHPVPRPLAVDARPRLVRADDPGSAKPREDGADLRIEQRLAALEGGIERSFADHQAKQFEQEPAEAAIADVVDEAQVYGQGDDVRAGRRAHLQPLGQRRRRGLATAPTMPREQLHPRDDRLDLGQIDLVVACQKRQVGLAQCRLAMRAAGWAGGHGLVRNLSQQATGAFAPHAALARTAARDPVIPVRLLALRGRQARVVRRLRRLAEFRLQPSDARAQASDLRGQDLNLLSQRLNLRPERMDQRVLLLMGEARQIGQALHPNLESTPPWLRQADRRTSAHGPHGGGGGGQLRN